MKKLTTEEFIEKAIKIHGNTYDYSKVEYVNSQTKVCIICPKHGEFWQTSTAHLYNKQSCPLCNGGSLLNTTSFILKAEIKHDNKYDYSKVEYVGNDKKVCIICPEHGEFWQKPRIHLEGFGCRKCNVEFRKKKMVKTIFKFIKEANIIHNNKYDYSKASYKNAKTKVCIICPEHGEFWQTPIGHINNKQGCPICYKSKLENEVSIFLSANKIKYEMFKKFEWLRNENFLSLDFYLPDYDIAIECQGGQHFISVSKFGGLQNLEKVKERDECKLLKCKKNGVRVIYFLNKKYNKYLKNMFYKNEIICNNTIDLLKYIDL
jgi:rubrerythrin